MPFVVKNLKWGISELLLGSWRCRFDRIIVFVVIGIIDSLDKHFTIIYFGG